MNQARAACTNAGFYLKPPSKQWSVPSRTHFSFSLVLMWQNQRREKEKQYLISTSESNLHSSLSTLIDASCHCSKSWTVRTLDLSVFSSHTSSALHIRGLCVSLVWNINSKRVRSGTLTEHTHRSSYTTFCVAKYIVFWHLTNSENVIARSNLIPLNYSGPDKHSVSSVSSLSFSQPSSIFRAVVLLSEH